MQILSFLLIFLQIGLLAGRDEYGNGKDGKVWEVALCVAAAADCVENK
jgi:hypothetical protein